MKLRGLLAILAATALFSALGCGVRAPVIPPMGLIWTSNDAPISIGPGDFGARRGEASVTTILALFSVGDGSVKAAAANGGINQVKRLDYHYTNFLGIYQSYTTIAYGD